MAKTDKDIQVRRNEDRSLANDRGFDLDRAMDRFLTDPFGSLFGELPNRLQPRRPLSQIKEKDDCYILRAELPGVPQEDIRIDVNGNVMSISAEHSEERENVQEYRSFQQSFTLPSTINADRIEANVENGVLEIMLPKVEVAQPKRVEVQNRKGGFVNRLLNKESKDTSKSEKH